MLLSGGGFTQEILGFINKFKQYERNTVLEKTFTQGFCYYFAVILNERFDGEIVYIKDIEHFVFKKDEMLFDITGNVTKKYQDMKIIQNWKENKTIIKQCILK